MDNKLIFGIKMSGCIVLSLIGIITVANTCKCNASDSVAEPNFSVESGIYDNTFQLKITADTGCKIYYTLDGNNPDTTSQLYTDSLTISNRSSDKNVLSAHKDIQPIERRYGGADCNFINTFAPTTEAVPKGTVVRAIAVDSNGNKSSVITNSYFVGLNTVNKYNNLPIISLVTDQYNLFDYEYGIYCLGKIFDDFRAENDLASIADAWEWDANYSLSGSKSERDGYIQMFEPDGTMAFSQGVGIRIHGGATRSYLQKSFKIYSRPEYDSMGQSKICYDIFKNLSKKCDPSVNITEFNSILLRNGGNDCDYTKLKDTFIQHLVRDRSFSTQAARPCIVFLDGEYWSVYNITEKYDSDYLKTHYDVKNSNIVMVKNSQLEEGEDTDIELYNNVITYAKNNDLSKDEFYNKFCEMIDIRSFIDYYATEIYIANYDWPNNNTELWRVRNTSDKPFEDGKWRWMLFDSEFSMGLYTKGAGSDDDMIRYAAQMDPLFRSLLKNAKFKEQFANTLFDLANVNFDYERVDALLTELSGIYRPLMGDYYERFTTGGSEYSLTGNFDVNVNASRNFLKKRQNAIYKIAKSALSLKGSKVNVTLQSNVKKNDILLLNTVSPDMSSGDWSGYYYNDYPISLIAKDVDGYTFCGWDIQGATASQQKDNELTLKLGSSSAVINAKYTKIP